MIDVRIPGLSRLYPIWQKLEAKQDRVASCQDAQKGSKTSTTFDSWAFILPGSLSTHALGNIGIHLH